MQPPEKFPPGPTDAPQAIAESSVAAPPVAAQKPSPVTGFQQLFAAELKWRLEHGDPEALEAERTAGGRSGIFTTSPAGSAEAPRVTSTGEDCVGLAFSGGGIRSATFNLGVLQGLDRLKILPHIDYLSTVSGGGYIGAWWSAWLARRELDSKAETVFPTPKTNVAEDFDSSAPEAEEIRHLREFSNFLAPRIGFFESETWAAVQAVVSVLIPALTVALSIVAIGLLFWVFGAWSMLATPMREGGPLLALFGLAIVQVVAEIRWRSAAKAEICAVGWWLAANAIALLAVWKVWTWIDRAEWLHPTGAISDPKAAFGLLPGAYPGTPFSFDGRLFEAPVAIAAAAILLFSVRIVVLRVFRGELFRVRIAAIDRVLQRMFAAALVWSIGGALWIGGAYLHHIKWGSVPVAGGAAASGALFAFLRNWIATQLAPGKKAGVFDMLKPLLPQLLALLAVALTAICIAAALAAGFEAMDYKSFFVAMFAISTGVVAAAAALFDPALVSMHAFYRNRLARAYLGASNKDALKDDAIGNRHIDVREKDDIPMRDLLPQRSGTKRGPLHLVCCAANDVGGDQLGNLARAARSAVLSPIGFQINDHWRKWRDAPGASPTSIDRLTLSSAITASAAAFNSNMGSLSSELGTLVCFLMSALNMRLGLWLPHPGSGNENLGWFPGVLFLKEMFGATHSGVRRDGQPIARYVHLSDGAHFENLALYELVRRHCRYIIVSDCGADPDVAFDDFGNAIRRIREDFGIEIDTDLSPLKPNPDTKLSRQHMVVGSIYYDRGRTDIGTLLLIKPTLTGDEPCDVTQYRTRNEQFPHESTGDQFYDEAQWESYRRLGSHAIQEAMRFVERSAKASGTELKSTARDVFIGSRQEWYPAPGDLSERVAAAMDRISQVENQIQEQGLSELMDELFPEIGELKQALAKPTGVQSITQPAVAPVPPVEAIPAPPVAATTSPSEQLERSLPAILEMFRLMESIWLSCHLDSHWNHPMNLGLFNLFQRWAYAPTPRLWWTFLRSLHGSGFRRFMEERFTMRDSDYPPAAPVVQGPFDKMPKGLAWLHWCRSHEDKLQGSEDGLLYYEYRLSLSLQEGSASEIREVSAQLGLAIIRQEGSIARVQSEEFFVPPSLWGAGLGGTFIEKLKKMLPPGIESFEVLLPSQVRRRRDRASREEYNDLLAFYKATDFNHEQANDKFIWRPSSSR